MQGLIEDAWSQADIARELGWRVGVYEPPASVHGDGNCCAGSGQGPASSTISRPLPSWSRKANIGGTPSQRKISSTSTPLARLGNMVAIGIVADQPDTGLHARWFGLI